MVAHHFHAGFCGAGEKGIFFTCEKLSDRDIRYGINVFCRIEHGAEPLAVDPSRKRSEKYDSVHALVFIDGLQCYFYKRLSYIAGKIDGLSLDTVPVTLPENGVLVILLAVIVTRSYHSKLRNDAFSGKVPYGLPDVCIYFVFYSIAG